MAKQFQNIFKRRLLLYWREDSTGERDAGEERRGERRFYERSETHVQRSVAAGIAKDSTGGNRNANAARGFF